MRIFALDLRSVALLRIALAALILYDLVERATFLRAHYTDDGIYPRAALAFAQGRVQWSLHLAVGSVAGVSVLFVIAALFASALLVGFHTRVASIASWILLVSLQNRTPAVCYGADAELRALLLFALFLPLDARFSVDAHNDPTKATRADDHRSVAALALTIQIAAIYVFTALLKLPDASWRHLTAVGVALHTEHHATALGLWLGQFDDVTRALTFATLALEMFAPLLLFIPFSTRARDRVRLALIVAFIAFHASTALALHLGYFPLVSALAWLVFLPASAWDRAGVPTRTGVDVERHRAVSIVSGTAAALVLASNLTAVFPSLQLPGVVDKTVRAIAMQQRWLMFFRPMRDGWLVGAAHLADGRDIDVLRHGEPLSWDKPRVVADQFPNMRWRKFLTDLTQERPVERDLRYWFARSICRNYNHDENDATQRMLSVDLVFMQEPDVDAPDAVPASAPIKQILLHHDCARGDDP